MNYSELEEKALIAANDCLNEIMSKMIEKDKSAEEIAILSEATAKILESVRGISSI